MYNYNTSVQKHALHTGRSPVIAFFCICSKASVHDLELNYAARDFYYIPIQMTSANRDVKLHRRSGDHASCPV